jgi:tRNA threonylcarbamoyladenosine biosynthesis protein TsaB
VAERFLIVETSHPLGQVAIALDGVIVAARPLDESRRHARDLVPAVAALLQAQGWRASDLTGVIVSRGPGSYTGLRVGLMSAKTLAYATGCALLAVDTFEAIYRQVRSAHPAIDVIADAQQDKIYVQRFGPQPEPLAIVPFADWLERARTSQSVVTGPGLEIFAARLSDPVRSLPREFWLAQPAGLLETGLERYRAGERDDPFQAEPLYLRPSSAEEKWRKPV